MISEELKRKLSVPQGKIDVVLDTDTFNEVDDQFAIAYMLKSKDKLNVKAIYAEHFLNEKASSRKEGMEKSYQEILKVLSLAHEKVEVYKGSTDALKNEYEPVISDAALDLVRRAKDYTSEKPLYVAAIGAITNIASAILIDPSIKDKIVVVWIGGHAWHLARTEEFNLFQDIHAGRFMLKCGVPFVQIPCKGVTDLFRVSYSEFKEFFIGKNELSTYLALNAIQEVQKTVKGDIWTRVIWDVLSIAWLLNDEDRFMNTRIVKARIPNYDYVYEDTEDAPYIAYVYYIKGRDALLSDLIEKLTK